MKAQLQPTHPRIRCQECGDARVVAVCHHCGAALCAQHERAAGESLGGSFEFSELGLEPARAAHCSRCAHGMNAPLGLGTVVGLLVAGVLLGLAGLAAAPALSGLGVLLFLAGLIAALVRRRQWQQVTARRPEFPALPQLRRFEIEETLRLHQALGADGLARLRLDAATGRAAVLATLTEVDRERLGKFARKYRLPETASLPVCAGFVGFDPAVFRAEAAAAGATLTTLLPLRSQVGQLAFLGGDPTRAAAEWKHEVTYGLGLDNSPASRPLRIVPSLVHDRSRRDLQLELSWEGEAGGPVPTVEQIELLELNYPATLGTVTCVRDGCELDREARLDATGQARLTARVLRPQVSDGPEAGGAPAGLRRFYFQFEHPTEAGQHFSGRAVVILRGALSGLQRATLFSPLGYRREQARAEITTRIELTFEFSAAPLLYSVLKLMPASEAAAGAASAPRMATRVFEGVNAAPELVMALTAALARGGFYVKSVTEENPKQHHRTGGHLRHRTWDLLGRRYHGVHPTDFHLVLQGEESTAQRRCRLTVSLNAQGSHADQEAGHRIEDDWAEIFAVLQQTIAELPAAEPEPESPPEPPRPAGPSTGTGAAESQAPPPVHAARERLLKAYLAGAVPEDLFRQLLADFDRPAAPDQKPQV